MTDARLTSSSRTNMMTETHDVPSSKSTIDLIARSAQSAVPMWNLTPQQWRVFLLVGKAMSNKAIAHELNVAESTVKAHVSAIFKLAKCRNRTEAALLSQRVRFGIVETSDPVTLPFAIPHPAAMKSARAVK